MWLLLISATAVGQSSGGAYVVQKTTFDGGGSSASGGSYSIQTTISQPDASTDVMTGGLYEMNTGFWTKNGDLIFKDDF